LESGEASQRLLKEKKKPRKTCVEMAGSSTLRMYTDRGQNFKTIINLNYILKSLFVPRSKHTTPALYDVKTSKLMMYREMMTFCCEDDSPATNNSVEFMNVEPGGTSDKQ
jgi:hypothetical protein